MGGQICPPAPGGEGGVEAPFWQVQKSLFLYRSMKWISSWEVKTEILSTRGKRFFVELFHGRDGKVMKQEWVTIVQIVLSYKTSNCPGKRVGQSGWGLGDGGRQVQFLSQIDSNIETTLRGEEEEEEEVEEPSQQRRHQGRKNWVIFCEQLVHCQQSISIEYMQCRQTITLFNPLFWASGKLVTLRCNRRNNEICHCYNL